MPGFPQTTLRVPYQWQHGEEGSIVLAWGSQSRLANLRHFYEILATLEHKVGGARTLDNCDSKTGWPERGIYFFLEPGEFRSDFGDGLRVVRVGTHAVTSGSRRKLWTASDKHKGTNRPSGGNHRGSIFRLLGVIR